MIDGTIGFVGGLNIGDEYLGRNKDIGFWRDTHLMVKGRSRANNAANLFTGLVLYDEP